MAGLIQTLILSAQSSNTLSFHQHRYPNLRPICNQFYTRSSISFNFSRSISVPTRIRACDRSDGSGRGAAKFSSSPKGLALAKPLSNFVDKNFLPLALIGGVLLGLANPSLGCLADKWYLSKISTVGIFFISGLTLQNGEIGNAVKAWPAGLIGLDLSTQQSQAVEADPFACPICYEPLIRKGPPGFNLSAIYRSGFKCKKCNKTYTSKDNYLDLTITAAMKEYTEVKPSSTELFRSPLVSFLYERGWRQNFNQSGFPGPDEEFKMAQEYFKPAKGGLIVDVSCGSGLFSRKFAKSGSYSKVIALDFSENMLLQCYDFIKQDKTISNANLALVRADISRLPFPSGSVDAVHAGAALHCWPSPSNAAESRIQG